MILVTAAFGNQGRRLIPRLVRAGASVRALRASAGGEAALRELGATEVVIGDAADPVVLRRAMQGVSSVYHVGPSAHPRERQMGMNAIDCARDAGVGHVVFSSVLHSILTGLVQHELKRDIEERLVESGLNFTILQPADYMQVQRYAAAFESGQFAIAWNRERKQSLVDLEDVAEVATKVLLEGAPHYGATYQLSAPGAHSAYEIADILARIRGMPVTAVEVSPLDRMRDFFKGKDLTDDNQYTLRVFEKLQSWYSAHDFVGNPTVLTLLLGRPPRSLEEFFRAEFANDRKS